MLSRVERVGWLPEHGQRRVRVRAQVRLVCAVLTFVVSKADTGRCNVGVARDGQAAGEVDSIVCGHVRRTSTAEVDRMIEDDIFTTTYFTETSVCIDFNNFISTCKFRRVIITNEVGFVRTRRTNFRFTFGSRDEDVATREERVELCDINVAPRNEVMGRVVDARVGVRVRVGVGVRVRVRVRVRFSSCVQSPYRLVRVAGEADRSLVYSG